MQRSRRYKLVACAKDDRFNILLEWVKAREPTAPTIFPYDRVIVDAARFG